MVNRNRSTIFYFLLVVVASVMVGMVLASRLDLASQSSAQTLGVPAVNSAPITGPVSATTFRERPLRHWWPGNEIGVAVIEEET